MCHKGFDNRVNITVNLVNRSSITVIRQEYLVNSPPLSIVLVVVGHRKKRKKSRGVGGREIPEND